MHNLSQLSRRYLRRQWKRTFFTSMGIIMATALFAGIALLFTSFIGMFVTAEAKEAGTWHYHISGLSMEQADRLQADKRIKDSEQVTVSKYLGYFPNPDDPDDQALANWLVLRDAGELDDALTPFSVSLVSGRLPQAENEITLNTAAAGWLFPDAVIGDTVTLDLVEQGQDLTKPVLSRKYTLVGFVGWADTNLPGPAHFALTNVPIPEQYNSEVYLTVKSGPDYKAQLVKALTAVFPDRDIQGQLGSISSSAAFDEGLQGLQKLHIQTHDGLLRYLGQSSYDDTNNQLMIFFGLLTLIIMVSVIFVIRNSFAMSVHERMLEFGLLRVVGGSPSQVRRLVLYDALQLALVSIPLGLLAGLAAMQITLTVVSGIDLPMIGYLTLIVSPWPLAAAAALSLFSIILAALSPAFQAGRLSPIEAVRRSDAYKVRPGKDRLLRRHGKINRLLFGPAGILASRNVHRDRRRFRNTALSVAISAILFLAAGGISLQFSQEMSAYDTETVDFRVSGTPAADFAELPDLTAVTRALQGNEQVKRLAAYGSFAMQLPLTEDQFSVGLVEAMQKMYDMNGVAVSEAELRGQLLQSGIETHMILADRALLDTLGVRDADMVWTAMQQGEAMLCQTASISLNGLGADTVAISTFKTGDTVSLAPYETTMTRADGSQETLQPIDMPLTYQIAAELDSLPWFFEGFFTGNPTFTLIVDREYMQNHTLTTNPDYRLYIDENLAVEALDGHEADVQNLLGQLVPDDNTGQGQSLYLTDNYQSLQSSRNMLLVINIFVFGFTIVIILICSMNILNTVTTNVLLRRRELAMLQAVGMSRQQVRRMLFIECTLYGVTGAVWGSLFGVGLLYLLGSSIDRTFGGMALSRIPWELIGITLAGALTISILAGILPVRRVMSDKVVEAIRAEE